MKSGLRWLCLLQLVQLRQNFRAVLAGIDARVYLGDLALRVDQKAVACRKLRDPKVGQRSVGIHDFVIGVGKQLEVQTLSRTKIFVGIDAVAADAQDDGIAFDIMRLIHLKLVGFAGSTRRLIFWIEIQHDPFPPVILQADGSAVL